MLVSALYTNQLAILLARKWRSILITPFIVLLFLLGLESHPSSVICGFSSCNPFKQVCQGIKEFWGCAQPGGEAVSTYQLHVTVNQIEQYQLHETLQFKHFSYQCYLLLTKKDNNEQTLCRRTPTMRLFLRAFIVYVF